MKKLMLIALFGIFAGNVSHAQIAIVRIRPLPPIFVRPVCPGSGHIWVEGSWRWDRRLRRNIWIDGYWHHSPQRFHPYGRARRF